MSISRNPPLGEMMPASPLTFVFIYFFVQSTALIWGAGREEDGDEG